MFDLIELAQIQPNWIRDNGISYCYAVQFPHDPMIMMIMEKYFPTCKRSRPRALIRFSSSADAGDRSFILQGRLMWVTLIVTAPAMIMDCPISWWDS